MNIKQTSRSNLTSDPAAREHNHRPHYCLAVPQRTPCSDPLVHPWLAFCVSASDAQAASKVVFTVVSKAVFKASKAVVKAALRLFSGCLKSLTLKTT